MTIAKLGLRKAHANQRRPQPKRSAKLSYEVLESRRVLANVGEFERFNATPGLNNDLWAEVRTNAIANSYDDPQSGQGFSDMMVREAEWSFKSNESAHAGAHAKAAGFILTEIGHFTSLPLVSYEGVAIANALNGGDGDWAVGGPLADGAGSGLFQFHENPENTADKSFYGAIYVPAVGIGTGGGGYFSWNAWDFSVTGSISKNGSEIAKVYARSRSRDSDTVPYQLGWDVTVVSPGHDPYSYTTGGVNLYVNFITDVADGNWFEFEASVAHGSLPEVASASSAYGGGGSNAQLNFIKSATAYGFVFETDNPPELPPLWQPGDDSGQGLGSGMFESDYGPGDLDGDGDIDDQDLQLWKEVIFKASNDSTTEILRPLIVTTEEDGDDGDYSFHDLSLREAITLAGSLERPGTDTIVFAKWVDHITLDNTALAVDNNVKIVGPGADKLTVDGDGVTRVFYVGSGIDATINGITITGGAVNSGSAYGSHGAGIYNAGDLSLISVDVVGNIASSSTISFGGGIYSSGGDLEIVRSTVDGNSAQYGGGITAGFDSGKALQISRSTISNNAGLNSAGAGGGAGGLYLNGVPGATLAIDNSTISGNRSYDGAGIYVGLATTVLNVTNSTIADNHTKNVGGSYISGGVAAGINNSVGGTVTLHNTILADNVATNTAWHNGVGSLAGSGSSHNLVDITYSGIGITHGPTTIGNGNKVGSGTRLAALLAPLGDYGGRTKTHALKVNSPALDAGKGSLSDTADQRGYVREYNLSTADGIDGYRDIGAYEASTGTTLIVRSDSDRNDSVDLRATIDSLRLREALALSAALAGTETILFDQSGWSDGEIDLNSTWGYLTIASDLSIGGPGADALTIDAQNNHRVLYVNSGVSASIEGVRVTGGNSSVAGGGGIYSLGNLSLNGVQIDGNHALTGGGIWHALGALTITGTTIYNNSSILGGGGLVVAANGTALTMLNSTVSTNVAGITGNMFGSGGGASFGSGTVVRIVNSTFTLNSAAASGGGIHNSAAGTRLDNTIVANNTAVVDGPDIYGTFSGSSRHNLIGVDSVTSNGIDNADGNGNMVGYDARLSAIGSYGGKTLTHVLRYDSPAIDAGDDAIDDLFGLQTDQRGFGRTKDSIYSFADGIDIGAVELAMSEYHS